MGLGRPPCCLEDPPAGKSLSGGKGALGQHTGALRCQEVRLPQKRGPCQPASLSFSSKAGEEVGTTGRGGCRAWPELR